MTESSTDNQDAIEFESVVVRPLWEARHEWEARVKFVEDFVADYGLETAINLSLVWSNMKFLGCSYPAGTEALVSHYEMPSLEELRARRKCKNSIAKYKMASQPSSSENTSFAEVSALLTSIHTQSSIKATHPQLQTIANGMCLCKECLGLSENDSYSKRGVKVLELLQKSNKDFSYRLAEDTGQLNKMWSLIVHGEVVLKSSSELLVLEDFVKVLNNWQEANQKPACPLVASTLQKPESSPGFRSNSSPQSHSDYYSSSNQQGGYVEQQGYRRRQSGQSGQNYYNQDTRNQSRPHQGW